MFLNTLNIPRLSLMQISANANANVDRKKKQEIPQIVFTKKKQNTFLI